MSDYSPLPVTSKDWVALPVAAEETMISVRSGTVLATNHSNPSGENGHELAPGVTMHLPAQDAWKFRMAGAQAATIYRTAAVANTAVAPSETVIALDEQQLVAGLSYSFDCAACLQAEPGVSYAASGLPAGLTLDSETGVVSGRALAEASCDVRVTATDPLGRRRSLTWRLVVSALQYAVAGGRASGLANDDGGRCVTVEGGDCAGTWVLSPEQAKLQDAGLPLILDFRVERTATGWQAISPLVLSAEGDVPVVRYEHRVAGALVSTGSRLDYSGVKDVDTIAVVESLNTPNAAVFARAAVAVQRVPVFAPAPTRFAPVKSSTAQADNPVLVWDKLGQPATIAKMTYMASAIVGVPDGQGGYTTGVNATGEVVLPGFDTGWGEAPRIRISKGIVRPLFSPSSNAALTYWDLTNVLPGDRVDAAVSFGIDRGDGGVWCVVRVRLTPGATGVPGGWLKREVRYNAGTVFDMAAVKSIRLGNASRSGAATISRAAVWLGSAMDIALPDELRLLFDDAAPSTLAHPAVAAEKLGQAQIDYYEGSNHGTFGAPTCLNPSLISC